MLLHSVGALAERAIRIRHCGDGKAFLSMLSVVKVVIVIIHHDASRFPCVKARGASAPRHTAGSGVEERQPTLRPTGHESLPKFGIIMAEGFYMEW